MQYNSKYLTIDKLSKTSLQFIDIALKRFIEAYDIDNYPIDCFELMNRICNSHYLSIELEEAHTLSPAFDACAQYFPGINTYLVVINANKKGSFDTSKNRRCNFTIAHELAHIFLGHLEIPDELKSKEQRDYENLEADEFAGRLLVPEKLLLSCNFYSKYNVAKEFLVSNQALYKRINNLKMLEMYQTLQKDKVCIFCGNADISLIAEHCTICGCVLSEENTRGVSRIVYSGPEVNSEDRLDQCLVCENEEVSKRAVYCKICGNNLYNICGNESIYIQCFHVNKSAAGYCEICGSRTNFIISGFLTPWRVEKREYIRRQIL